MELDTDYFGGVQTAVPAFIGYTEKAEDRGQSLFNKACPVGSMAAFEKYFGKGYRAVYDIKEQMNPRDGNYDFKVPCPPGSPPVPGGSPPVPRDFQYYYLQQNSNTKFYLYDSMRLFYANGGGNCYVVSVGNYEQGAVIQASDLMRGLDVIKDTVGPTMLVIPDAMLLNAPHDSLPAAPASSDHETFTPSLDYQTVARAMLQQAAELRDRVAILDVYGTLSVYDQTSLDAVVGQFRQDVGSENLSYGAAYFPFLHTGVVKLSDFNYTNLSPIGPVSTPGTLQHILESENERLYADNPGKREQISKDIQRMSDPIGASNTIVDVVKRNQNLSSAIPLLADIELILVEKNAVLPPSGAMAGVYTYVDMTRGVWNAPANVTLKSIYETTFKLNDTQQVGLNMPIDGKAVNAIREFVNRGSVVWGARTLAGNSNFAPYIQVRRTMNYIEKSIESVLNWFVFSANDPHTWMKVTARVSNFLTGLWSQGVLMGAKASDAFTVQCGIGSTMTGQDILDGYMVVSVTLSIIAPAEFNELTFKQQMGI
jgi:hypothetical protein